MSCKTIGTIKTLQGSEIKFLHYFSLNLLYSFFLPLLFLHREESGYLTNHRFKDPGDIEMGIYPTGEFSRKGLCLASLSPMCLISNCWVRERGDTVQLIMASNTYKLFSLEQHAQSLRFSVFLFVKWR